MNRPVIKFITDFGPTFSFFYNIFQANDNDLKLAIPPFIIVTLNCTGSYSLFFRKENFHSTSNQWNIHYFIWWSYFILSITKYSFYMKPTVINLLVCMRILIFWSVYVTKKSLLKIFFKNKSEFKR